MRAQRFRATIHKQGPNPYVDVPERVSRAFARFGRAGRIRVAGRLNRTPVQALLVPARAGRHRLFVNGGMRAAAAVGVGDTVSFSLRPTHPDAVRLPADLAAALRRVQNARAAFDRLSVSHRRQLIRYIDDARTPVNRQKRILKAAHHVLGKRAPASRPDTRTRPLWTCPRCGAEFVNRNQFHSCKQYQLADVFAGKPVRIQELFGRFQRMVKSCGPLKRVVYRDRVGFMVRVRFAGAVPKANWLDVAFWLPRRIDLPRFHRIETIYPHAHVHLLRITEPGQLDAQLQAWIKEAYAVGCQEHLAPGNTAAS